ncbi:hypothetical protein ALQ03_200055 [Pseudomonas savastanoi pv. glycinea]|nr:hypothetical protein ALQ03_200055 [Pseudomonas savastanoi pv. glycinea]
MLIVSREASKIFKTSFIHSKNVGLVSRRRSNQSIRRAQPEKHFWTCWACLLSLKLTCDANGSLKELLTLKLVVFTGAANRRLTRWKFSAYGPKKI